MGFGGFPDLTLFYMSIYGGFGYDFYAAASAYQGMAAGIPQTGNPPYTVVDFFSMNPKFAGPATSSPAVFTLNQPTVPVPVSVGMGVGQLVTSPSLKPGTIILDVATAPITVTGDTTIGQATVTNLSSTAGLMAGQPWAGPNIPPGTYIGAISGAQLTMVNAAGIAQNAIATGVALNLAALSSTLTLSASPTAAGASTIAVYEAPPVPLMVVQVYLNLAYASLMSSRWREAWPVAMGLYIAHFLTLYAQSDGSVQTTPGAIAAAGLERGLTVSKSADGLSVGYQQLTALEQWAAWAKTTYGTQLATMARVVGCGPIYVR